MTVNFDRISGLYDATRSMPGGMAEKANQLLIKAGGLKAGSVVLELGVGTGRIAIPIVKTLPVKYFGIDISVGMTRKIFEKAPGSVRVARADVSRPPFRNGVFDAIIAVHIFHLVPRWRESLIEARRVLKKGAPLLVAGEGGFQFFWMNTLAGDFPDDTKQRLLRIVANLGLVRNVGMQSMEECVGTLKEMGATVSVVEPISNSMELPLNVVPALMSARVFSSLWETPQDVLDAGVKELNDVLKERYGSLDKKFTLTRKFELIKAVF